MKLVLTASAAFAAMAMATAATAEQPSGWYAAGDLGANWKSDQKLKSDNTTGVANNYYRYNLSTKDVNGVGFARLGYRFNDKWRIELEGGYRPGTIDKAVGPRTYFPGDDTTLKAPDSAICGTVTATACSDPHGHLNQTSLMVNAVRDLMADYRFHPFIGAGIGLDSVSTSTGGVISRTGQNITIKGNKVEPAIQGLLGVAYAMSDRLSFEVGYRLMFVGKMKYNSSVSALPTGGTSSTTANNASSLARMNAAVNNAAVNAPGGFSGDFTNQSLTIGLRYTFGHAAAPPPPPAPPAPPPPPPAPPPIPLPPVPPVPPAAVDNSAAVTPPAPAAKTFVVYFRFNHSSLTADAKAVVQAAADYATGNKASKVAVVGYTDTSGSKAYNLKLSARRARSTAKALVADGVDKKTVTLDWKGENDLAVPTKDGVREPANRRATIDVAF